MKSLLKVKVFNRIQEEKYKKDVSEYNYNHRGFPFLAMYVFTKSNGVPRKKGYVVSEGNSHKFYHTKEEVFSIEGMRLDI